MTNYTGTRQTEIEFMNGFVEAEQDPYICVEEISGTTPLTILQSHMLDPLARELAKLIRELIVSEELLVSEDGVVRGKIGITE